MALDPTSMHLNLRTAEFKSWMKIKAGPKPHRGSQLVSVMILSRERGACSLSSGTHPVTDCISSTLSGSPGIISEEFPTKSARTQCFYVPGDGNLVQQPGDLYREPVHTQDAPMCTQACRASIHTGLPPSAKCVIILWSNTIW